MSKVDKQITDMEKENKRLKKEIEKLEKENKELKKRLKFYENPHTPPSRLKLKHINLEKKPGKRGAPVGHKGTTRSMPPPTKIIDVVEKKCPYCQGELMEPIGVNPLNRTISWENFHIKI